MPKLLSLALALLLCPSVRAQTPTLQLFETFTDHAVLQRNVDEHPIWGWAKPKRRVTVTLGERTRTARADENGRWQVEIATGEAGGPHTLTVKAAQETQTISDLYFGDVYLLSGQSNMEWRLAQSDPDGSRARDIADPLVRHLKIERTFADLPEERLTLNEPWKPGTADEIGDFSGVGSYFAHYLRQEVDVPIGLVHASWGGSRIEPWISAEAQGIDTEAMIKDKRSAADVATAEARKTYNATFGPGDPPTEDRGVEMGYLKTNFDDRDWPSVEVPGVWEGRGYLNVDGHFYYRRSFNLTAEQARAAKLYLGPIDDGDLTYINGKEVGDTPNSYSEPREYNVPAGVLKAGANTIAVRVFDGGGGGGFYGSPHVMRLATAAGDVPLAGQWKYRIGEWRSDPQPNQVPTILYNKMIAPLKGLPLTGTLWYQGESNAGPGNAEEYAGHLRTLVASWREHFDHDDMPFYWVSLANFQDAQSNPMEEGWGVIREQMTEALDVDHTGQAIITDIGEAGDIHPRNKWEVGRRLSLHALRNIYGRDVQASSPMVRRADQEDGGVLLEFEEVGEGLTVKTGENDRYGYLKGFSIQDVNGDWHWAQAVLTGNDKIMVYNPAGTGIEVVRYAYASNPADANLFSKEGLPATPFEIEVD